MYIYIHIYKYIYIYIYIIVRDIWIKSASYLHDIPLNPDVPSHESPMKSHRNLMKSA